MANRYEDRTHFVGSIGSEVARATTKTAAPRLVGELLRDWRARRKLSQLALALEAEVSARHLSFVETGRAAPSRETLLRLARALDMSLRDRNELFLAAGYAPLYHETDLTAPASTEVRRTLEFLLAQYEPNPAIVTDRSWNILMANKTVPLLAEFVHDPTFLATLGAPNVVRLVMHDAGLRRYIANWTEVASHLLGRLQRDVLFGFGGPSAAALLHEVRGYPDASPVLHSVKLERARSPALPLVLSRNGETLSFYTTITTFGTPLDVALEELRIETYFPADDVTRIAVTSAVR